MIGGRLSERTQAWIDLLGGLFILFLFNSTYGRVPLPWFFDAEPSWAQPWTNPWDWFRALLVPWLVLAAPLGAMCLRLTLSETRSFRPARAADRAPRGAGEQRKP